MNDESKQTLASIEALLTADRVSVKHALDAAYQLGYIDGGVEMARVNAEQVKALLRAPL